MTQGTRGGRRRRLLLGGVLVVAVAVGAAYLVTRRPRPTPTGADWSELLRLVPASATVVAAADVGAVARSGAGALLGPLLAAHRLAVSAAGIDLSADVDRVVVAAVPTPGAGRLAGALLARGRFDGARIDAHLREGGAAVDDYKGARLLLVRSASPRAGGSWAFAALGPGLVAFGDPPCVRAMLDVSRGAPGLPTNTDLMAVLAPMADGQVWVAGRYDAAWERRLFPRAIVDLPPLDWVSAIVRIDDVARVLVAGTAADPATASGLRDTLGGLLGFARPQLAARADWRDLADSIAVGGTGRTVTIAFAAAAPTVAALVALMPPPPADIGLPTSIGP